MNVKSNLEAVAQKMYGKSIKELDNQQIYYAILNMTKDMMNGKGQIKGTKKVYYISAEFLIGKLLSNNLINLGIYDKVEEVMKDEYGENWEEYWWNEYYNSNQGKEKIVYEFLSKNRDKYNYHYVSTDDNDELFISSFKDNNVHIPIDVFINDNNLKQN